MDLINNESIIKIAESPILINQFATLVYESLTDHQWNEIRKLFIDSEWNCFVFEKIIHSWSDTWKDLREILVLKNDWSIMKTLSSVIDESEESIVPYTLDWKIVHINKIKDGHAMVTQEGKTDSYYRIWENFELVPYRDESWKIVKVYDVAMPDKYYDYVRLHTYDSWRCPVDDNWVVLRYKLWNDTLVVESIHPNHTVSIDRNQYVGVASTDLDGLNLAEKLWRNLVWEGTAFQTFHNSNEQVFVLDPVVRNKLVPCKIDWEFVPVYQMSDSWLDIYTERYESYGYCRKISEWLWCIEYSPYKLWNGDVCDVCEVYEDIGIVKDAESLYYRMDKNDLHVLHPIEYLNDDEKQSINKFYKDSDEDWTNTKNKNVISFTTIEEVTQKWYDKAYRIDDEMNLFLDSKWNAEERVVTGHSGSKSIFSNNWQEDFFTREHYGLYKYNPINTLSLPLVKREIYRCHALSSDAIRWLYYTSCSYEWTSQLWYEWLVVVDWKPLWYILNNQDVVVTNTFENWKLVTLAKRWKWKFLTTGKYSNEIWTHKWCPVVSCERITATHLQISYVTLNDVQLTEVLEIDLHNCHWLKGNWIVKS